MDHEIVTYEDRDCPKHGRTKHSCHVIGHITWCFDTRDVKDIKPPEHGTREVTCFACFKEASGWDLSVVAQEGQQIGMRIQGMERLEQF